MFSLSEITSPFDLKVHGHQN